MATGRILATNHRTGTRIVRGKITAATITATAAMIMGARAMSDAPERIWMAKNGGLPTGNYPQGDKVQYIRADLAPSADKVAELVEALRGAVAAWDLHNNTGDMMQGDWVGDARAALAQWEAGD